MATPTPVLDPTKPNRPLPTRPPRFMIEFWLPFPQASVFQELANVGNPLGVEALADYQIINVIKQNPEELKVSPPPPAPAGCVLRAQRPTAGARAGRS